MQEVAYIQDIIFMNKQDIPWSEVETYLKQYVGQKYVVEVTKDVIAIDSDFPEEFSESKYTKNLRGGIAKAKANAAQAIGKMIIIATNKR